MSRTENLSIQNKLNYVFTKDNNKSTHRTAFAYMLVVKKNQFLCSKSHSTEFHENSLELLQKNFKAIIIIPIKYSNIFRFHLLTSWTTLMESLYCTNRLSGANKYSLSMLYFNRYTAAPDNTQNAHWNWTHRKNFSWNSLGD